jgi:hypothetical protein
MIGVRVGSVRIGQGFGRSYGSDLVHLSGEPQRPIESNSGSAVIAITIVYGGLAVVFLVLGVWFLALPLLAATVICWLRWAANPHSGTRTPGEQDAPR